MQLLQLFIKNVRKTVRISLWGVKIPLNSTREICSISMIYVYKIKWQIQENLTLLYLFLLTDYDFFMEFAKSMLGVECPERRIIRSTPVKNSVGKK